MPQGGRSLFLEVVVRGTCDSVLFDLLVKMRAMNAQHGRSPGLVVSGQSSMLKEMGLKVFHSPSPGCPVWKHGELHLRRSFVKKPV